MNGNGENYPASGERTISRGLDLAKRHLHPELLDSLDANDASAIQSRADLRRVNRWMGQARLFVQSFRRVTWPDRVLRVADLGAGDGTLFLDVARRMSGLWKGGCITLVDQQDIVTESARTAFQNLGWEIEIVRTDVFEWLASMKLEPKPNFDLICANLFLHHFDECQLQELFARAAGRCRRFAACEPRRSMAGLGGARMLWAIGCNRVTRHDAWWSVRAGFRGRELSLLWPEPGNWSLVEGGAGLFSHRFMARRKS